MPRTSRLPMYMPVRFADVLQIAHVAHLVDAVFAGGGEIGSSLAILDGSV